MWSMVWVRPAEDQIHADRQAERPARIERPEDLLRRLLAPAALINSSSSCCAPMLMRLMPQACMAASFSWLNVCGMPSSVTSMSDGTSKTPRDDVHQRGVLVGLVEVGGAAPEVDARQVGALEVGAEQLPFAYQVAEVGVELLSIAVYLGRKQAEAAASRIGRQAVRRADVQVDALAHAAGRRPAPVPHDRRHGNVPIEPEDGRRMPVQHLVALPAVPVRVDVGAYLSYVTHGGWPLQTRVPALRKR